MRLREEAEASQWTREGLLGATPKRATDSLPLSDQGNRGNWERYGPLSDEFEGDELDPEKWWPYDPNWKGRQPGFFYPGNVIVSDGELHLIMKKEEVPEMPKDEGYHTYTCACVKSRTKVLYGYFEVKSRPMRSAGSSSFWFYTDKGNAEIDVYELGGGAEGFERRYNMDLMVHESYEDESWWSVGGVWMAPLDLADHYHVYGLEWNETTISYYVDGVIVRSVKNTHWHQPLNLVFDSETMFDWLGVPNDEDSPSTYSIEFVRAWKRRSE